MTGRTMDHGLARRGPSEPMVTLSRRYTAGIWAAVALAVVWSVGLLVAANTVPVYGSETTSWSTGGSMRTIHHASRSLVEVNGSRVLAVVAIPLVASLLVGIALLRRRSGRVAHAFAWAVTGLVGFLSFVSILTIGLAIVPVGLFLGTACVLDMLRRNPGLR